MDENGIEVTPEMIEKGARALFLMLGASDGFGPSYEEVAVEVFKIMSAYRRKESVSPK